MQVYSRVPNMSRPSAVSTALFTTTVTEAAAILALRASGETKRTRIWWNVCGQGRQIGGICRLPRRRVGEGMEVASEDRLLRGGGAAGSAGGDRRISALVGGRNEPRGGDGLASAQK
jgi:hypothetical protein